MRKHMDIFRRALFKGGRHYPYLGKREDDCYGYISPCEFGEGLHQGNVVRPDAPQHHLSDEGRQERLRSVLDAEDGVRRHQLPYRRRMPFGAQTQD